MSDDTTLDDFSVDSQERADEPHSLSDESERGSEWGEKPLSDIFNSIYSGGTPKRGVDDYYNGIIPFVKIEDLNQQQGSGITTAEEHITEQAIEETSARSFDSGTLLMTIYGSLAETAVVHERVATNQGILGLWGADVDNTQYVRYAVDNTQAKLASLSRQTTQANLGKGIVKKHKIPVPPLSEQRKIATVLHTVDQAIQKTEEMVEQVERIEQGLLQDLFSGEHLDCKYQTESTLGRIPEHWDIFPMSEVCNITMGSSPKSEYYNESGDGLPFFQANNEFGLRNPTNDRWCSNPVKTAKKGDSLMTIRGTYVGQMNIADKECCIGRGLAGISAGEKLHSEYLYHHLRRRERYVKSIAIGSTFDSVSSGDLENLLIAVPPKNEQKQIAEILQRVQQKIIFSKGYVNKIGSIKQGLMQDLLSGKVRTTDVDIDIPEEVAKYG